MIEGLIFVISMFFATAVITPLLGYTLKLDMSSPSALLNSLLDNPAYLATTLMISLIIALVITVMLTKIYRKVGGGR